MGRRSLIADIHYHLLFSIVVRSVRQLCKVGRCMSEQVSECQTNGSCRRENAQTQQMEAPREVEVCDIVYERKREERQSFQ